MSEVDLAPNFDIYHEDGQEISANYDDDPIGTVYVGQRIRLNLEIEVDNDDVSNYLRDNDSDSIEGPVNYWIDGAISRTLYISEEFDVDDLDEGDEPDEEEWFVVSNHSGKILNFQAEVDGDDEVDEESEGNNTLRVERFLIESKGLTVAQILAILDSETLYDDLEENNPNSSDFIVNYTNLTLVTGTVIGYRDGIVEGQIDNFNLNDTIHFGVFADVTISHTWRIEAYYNGNLWWGQTLENREALDHSFYFLNQTVTITGTFTFKVFLDAGNGLEQIDEKNIIIE